VLCVVLAVAGRLEAPPTASAEPPESEPPSGSVRFAPTADEPRVPPRFRLAAHEFDYQMRRVETVAAQIEIYEVTFPSPVETPHQANNTVHAEYFRPAAAGPYPGVVVLHILGGDFDLARLFARSLAHNGAAALFIKMPYYGPRAAPDRDRMVTVDPRETVDGMTQGVLDIRRGAAWLAERQEIDADRLGVFGISLGGITAGLAAAAEPRFSRVCLMLAGGDLGQVSWNTRELAGVREHWLAQGGTEETFYETLRQVDPLTWSENVRGRRILMLNAAHDEVIPRACSESLWRAYGEPEIVWFDAGHYSAMRFLFDGVARVTRFFQR
jgi:dienelactone hydrolase